MQTQLTGPAAIVAVPAELGQVLADTSAWNDWALTLPRPARAPRVRRPGRIHRRVVALAAVAATAVVTLAGCAAAHHAPAAPGTPWLPGQVREVRSQEEADALWWQSDVVKLFYQEHCPVAIVRHG